jgi:hypothetical protein
MPGHFLDLMNDPLAHLPTESELRSMTAFARARAVITFPELVRMYPELGDMSVVPAPKRTNEFTKPAKSTMEQMRAEPQEKKITSSKTNEATFRRLTKDHYHGRGCRYVRVDSYNAFAGVANDLLGAFDGLAFSPGTGIVGVQLTSKTNMSARRRKLRENPLVTSWLESGGKVELIGWHKPGTKWEPVVERFGA